jgi:hypothetical protein
MVEQSRWYCLLVQLSGAKIISLESRISLLLGFVSFSVQSSQLVILLNRGIPPMNHTNLSKLGDHQYLSWNNPPTATGREMNLGVLVGR